MKKIDLYEIAIKVLGLYLVFEIVNLLREVLVYPALWSQYKENPDLFDGLNQFPIFIATLVGMLIMLAFSGLLLFKTRQVARLIGSKSDCEEDIQGFAEPKTIFRISLVLLGLIMVVFTLPDFLFRLKNHITLVQNQLPTKDYDTQFLIITAIKIGLGLVAIFKSDSLSALLSKTRNKA